MTRSRFGLSVVVLAVMTTSPCSGQQLVGDQGATALKGLRSVGLVFRLDDSAKTVTLPEWVDAIKVRLHRDLPSLVVADSATAWLELEVTTANSGAWVQLSVKRWARLVDSGTDVFGPLWSHTRLGFGGKPNRTSLIEALDSLLTAFAGDYIRANP